MGSKFQYLQDGFSQKNLLTEIRQRKVALLQEALKKTTCQTAHRFAYLWKRKFASSDSNYYHQCMGDKFVGYKISISTKGDFIVTHL